MSDAEFWNAQYRHRHHHHAHGPNVTLTELVGALTPGTALDVGCGEGRDARWLASRGWSVTGVDVSSVALEHAKAHASTVQWVEADVHTWTPPAETFDLVTSHFVHVAPDARRAFFAKLVHAVRRGGSVLFVSHHHSDHQTTVGRPQLPELFFSADELHAFLPSSEWTVRESGTRPRETRDPSGRVITINDALLFATRR